MPQVAHQVHTWDLYSRSYESAKRVLLRMLLLFADALQRLPHKITLYTYINTHTHTLTQRSMKARKLTQF